LRQSYKRQRECQIGIVIAPTFTRQGGKLTNSRFVAGIGHPRALVGTFVPLAEVANSPKMEFFDMMARLKPGLVELGYALDHGGQTRVHWWLCPLSLDNRREHELVLP
jgi:hypothetical protein